MAMPPWWQWPLCLCRYLKNCFVCWLDSNGWSAIKPLTCLRLRMSSPPNASVRGPVPTAAGEQGRGGSTSQPRGQCPGRRADRPHPLRWSLSDRSGNPPAQSSGGLGSAPGLTGTKGPRRPVSPRVPHNRQQGGHEPRPATPAGASGCIGQAAAQGVPQLSSGWGGSSRVQGGPQHTDRGRRRQTEESHPMWGPQLGLSGEAQRKRGFPLRSSRQTRTQHSPNYSLHPRRVTGRRW